MFIWNNSGRRHKILIKAIMGGGDVAGGSRDASKTLLLMLFYLQITWQITCLKGWYTKGVILWIQKRSHFYENREFLYCLSNNYQFSFSFFLKLDLVLRIYPQYLLIQVLHTCPWFVATVWLLFLISKEIMCLFQNLQLEMQIKANQAGTVILYENAATDSPLMSLRQLTLKWS